MAARMRQENSPKQTPQTYTLEDRYPGMAGKVPRKGSSTSDWKGTILAPDPDTVLTYSRMLPSMRQQAIDLLKERVTGYQRNAWDGEKGSLNKADPSKQPHPDAMEIYREAVAWRLADQVAAGKLTMEAEGEDSARQIASEVGVSQANLILRQYVGNIEEAKAPRKSPSSADLAKEAYKERVAKATEEKLEEGRMRYEHEIAPYRGGE